LSPSAKESFSLGSNENSSRFTGGIFAFIDFNDYCRMRHFEISLINLEQLPEVARNILEFTGKARVFAFYGEMGSGKTTLIKALCSELGSHDNFSSPTYSIVNEYLSPSIPSKIYHMDLYRLKSAEEALSVGIEEYIYSGNYCFIEWPELIEHYLPKDVAKIYIKCDGNVRNVSIFIE
jgi:tRNA threonylcarbamoyladenosine biosynthesis protein TsaE